MTLYLMLVLGFVAFGHSKASPPFIVDAGETLPSEKAPLLALRCFLSVPVAFLFSSYISAS